MRILESIADLFLSLAVAAVLSNWHNVLRAINMASSRRISSQTPPELTVFTVKIPTATEEVDDAQATEKPLTDVPLPQTLVRIPMQSAVPTNGNAVERTSSE